MLKTECTDNVALRVGFLIDSNLLLNGIILFSLQKFKTNEPVLIKSKAVIYLMLLTN